MTEASGLGDWRDDVCQRRIIVGGVVADGLVVPSSSESDVFADCCRRHSQRERERESQLERESEQRVERVTVCGRCGKSVFHKTH